MKAYTWDELIGLWKHWKKKGFVQTYNDNWGIHHDSNLIENWLMGFPVNVQRAAALAISYAKWASGNGWCSQAADSCGCCVLYIERDCYPCPLGRSPVDCTGESYKTTLNLITKKYTEAYEKLPKEWREK